MLKLSIRVGVTILALGLGFELPALPASAQSMYGHDRGWGHGHTVSGGTVPDDYLMPVGASDITRSSNPYGNYIPMSQQGRGGAQRRHIIRQNTNLARPLGAGGHSMAYLNGMGGVDPLTDGELVAEPVYTEQPVYQTSGRRYVSRGVRRRASTGGSAKPRMIYYPATATQTFNNGVYRSQAGFVGGGGTSYQLPGRGRY
jgi:hypothetical protein